MLSEKVSSQLKLLQEGSLRLPFKLGGGIVHHNNEEVNNGPLNVQLADSKEADASNVVGLFSLSGVNRDTSQRDKPEIMIQYNKNSQVIPYHENVGEEINDGDNKLEGINQEDNQNQVVSFKNVEQEH